MKKVVLFAAVLSAMSFASCKKERDCTCSSTYTFGGSTSTPTTETTTYKDVTGKQAKTLCVSSTTTDSGGGVSTRTCELK